MDHRTGSILTSWLPDGIEHQSSFLELGKLIENNLSIPNNFMDVIIHKKAEFQPIFYHWLSEYIARVSMFGLLDVSLLKCCSESLLLLERQI